MDLIAWQELFQKRLRLRRCLVEKMSGSFKNSFEHQAMQVTPTVNKAVKQCNYTDDIPRNNRGN